jgi:uncharacterized protein YkwD
MFNYIDFIIILIFILYILRGFQVGFLPLTQRLLSFIGSLFMAFWWYRPVAEMLSYDYGILPSVSAVASFLLIFLLGQIMLDILIGATFSFFPSSFKEGTLSRVLSVFPALIDASILVSLVLLLVIALPVSAGLKDDIMRSRTGEVLVSNISDVENYINEVFGGAIEDTLTFLTIRPESDESLSLPYRPRSLTIDEEAELRLLELLNQERGLVGASPLVLDHSISEVARLHSEDMWQRQYFSHTNPDGLSPFDRMRNGSIDFLRAGENLALAPNTTLAHRGLMNSPGHRRNILDTQFGRVGIGVVDGGIYGKMYTQKFAD